MEKTYDAICLGITVMDTLVQYAPRSAFDTDTTPVKSVTLKTGGDAVNQSVNLAGYGCKTGLIGLIGRDMLGDTMIAALEAAGVDTRFVARDAAIPTGACVVLIEENGERHFLYSGANNMRLCADNIDFDSIRSAKYLSIASLFSLPAFEKTALNAALDAAHEAGTVVVADFAGMQGDFTHAVRAIPKIDWIMPSYIEASTLTGEKELPAIVRGLCDMGGRNIIVKIGEKGCYVHSEEYCGMVPAFPAKVVDTTGAGDSFVAAFICARNLGWGVEKSVRFACAAGSITVEAVGATGNIHGIEQVMARAGL